MISTTEMEVYTCQCEFRQGFIAVTATVGLDKGVNIMHSHVLYTRWSDFDKENLLFPLPRIRVIWDDQFAIRDFSVAGYQAQQFRYVNEMMNGPKRHPSLCTWGYILVYKSAEDREADANTIYDPVDLTEMALQHAQNEYSFLSQRAEEIQFQILPQQSDSLEEYAQRAYFLWHVREGYDQRGHDHVIRRLSVTYTDEKLKELVDFFEAKEWEIDITTLTDYECYEHMFYFYVFYKNMGRSWAEKAFQLAFLYNMHTGHARSRSIPDALNVMMKQVRSSKRLTLGTVLVASAAIAGAMAVGVFGLPAAVGTFMFAL